MKRRRCNCCPGSYHCQFAAGALVAQWLDDPEKCAEADTWTDGTQDGDHYSAVESALADLHRVAPSDLLGSEVLKRLYRLAKVHGEARESRLMEMAEQYLEMDARRVA